MTPIDPLWLLAAFFAGTTTMQVVMYVLIVRRKPVVLPVERVPSTPAPRADPFTLSVELEGLDAIEANLARVNEAARQTADRLREVAELGERIARKPDTNT